jgi:TrmH family RNA methyltransferase
VAESRAARIRVVLHETQDLVNIAATARAMMNMGAGELWLVRPAAFDPRRILGVAHDARHLIDATRFCNTLDEAVAGCVLVAAFTARQRSAKWTSVTPRAAAERLIAEADQGPVAVVFGREDRGLPNDVLDRAHLHVTIPTTTHASLNLAQAVVIALYETHLAAGDATRARKPPRKDAPPPSAEQLERYFDDAARALERIDFFKTRYREHIMRTVRSLTLRAEPNARELSLMRAMAIEVVKNLDRVTGGGRDPEPGEAGRPG